MAILSMPSSPGIQRARFVLQAWTRQLLSPLTGSVQRIEYGGTRWLATYTLPPLTLAQAGAWEAFLVQLQGRAGRFYGGDPSGTTARGTATGTPRVNGAGQVGRWLVTDGWTAGQATILKAGDYLAWDTPSGWRELHKVTADTASDGSGRATIPLAPPLRETPADDALLTVTGATCVLALATDADGEWEADAARVVGITFSAVEMFAASVA